MKRFSLKLLPFFNGIKKYVERNSELPKEELIRRCAGKVSYGLLQALKQMVFYRIGKNGQDELYFI